MNNMFQITKQMIDYRRNHFFSQRLQTEFIFQQENKNKLHSVCGQLRNLNTIEPRRSVQNNSHFPPEMTEESSGESSVCEAAQRRLGAEEVAEMVVDTQSEQLIDLEARAAQKTYALYYSLALGLMWNGRIRLKSQLQMQIRSQYNVWICQPSLKNSKHICFNLRFKDKNFIQFKRISVVSYMGRLSILLKLKEDKAAQYVYFNLKYASYKYKRGLGENIGFGQLKEHQKSDRARFITIVLRFLPLFFEKDKLEQLSSCKCEELFEYKGYKYGVVKCADIVTAEKIKEQITIYLVNKKHYEMKINILSNQKWNENKKRAYQQFYEDSSQNPRVILQAKSGICLSPVKQPEIIIKPQELVQIEPETQRVPQPALIIKPIQIVQPIQIKPVQIITQKVAQLVPVKLYSERSRSDRKR